MLNGYDITNMSNDDINLIMQGINPEPYDPDKRLEPKEIKDIKIRTKLFTARDPEHLTKTMNNFFDEHADHITIRSVSPYAFSDKGT